MRRQEFSPPLLPPAERGGASPAVVLRSAQSDLFVVSPGRHSSETEHLSRVGLWSGDCSAEPPESALCREPGNLGRQLGGNILWAWKGHLK